MATTIQLKLLDNKRVETYVNGYPNAYEGGYRIVAGEQNATEFEISSVPAQYKNATFSLTLKNSMKEEVEAPEIVNNKFTLPVGMAVAGYGSIVITAKLDDEVIVWTPLKIKVWNTDPNWQNYVIVPTPIQIGETETLPAGSEAYVKNVGTALKPILNVGIPQGEKGEDGKSFDENGYYDSVHVGKTDKDAAGNILTSFYAHDIKFSNDNTNFVITAVAVNANGDEIGEPKKIDLPVESMVVNATYDNNTKSIILTLQNGNTISVPVGDLVNGLATTAQLNAETQEREIADTVLQNQIESINENCAFKDGNYPTLGAGKLVVDKAVGSIDKPVYFSKNGLPVECGSKLNVDIFGSAANANEIKVIQNFIGSVNEKTWYCIARVDFKADEYFAATYLIEGVLDTNETIWQNGKNKNVIFGILSTQGLASSARDDGWKFINIVWDNGNVPNGLFCYFVDENSKQIRICAKGNNPRIQVRFLSASYEARPVFVETPTQITLPDDVEYIGDDLPFKPYGRNIYRVNGSGSAKGEAGTIYVEDIIWNENNVGKKGDYVTNDTGVLLELLEDGSTALVETWVYNTGKYIPYFIKPVGGITTYDLSADVKESLEKANTALQDAPVKSVNGKTGNVEIPLDFLPLSGGNISGNISAQYITGTWLQITASNHLSQAASKICVLDASGWIYHRTASEICKDIGAAKSSQVNSVSMVPYGGQATTLSALASGGVYSISANGYLRIAYQTTAADNFIGMKQVDSSGADIWGALMNGQKSYGSGYPYIYMPVAAGDHIKVDFSSSVKIIQVQLIKVKSI